MNPEKKTLLTRRDFLKLSGVTVAALALGKLLPDSSLLKGSEKVSGEYNYLFQVDLPSGYALLRTSWFDSVDRIGKGAKVSVEQLKRENGLGDDNKIIFGEYLLVPISAGATANYIENDDQDLEKQLIVRAVRNPSLPPEKDFTDQEMTVLNRSLRWAESVKEKYLGNIDMTRGFARVIRATENEISHDPAHVSGEVSITPEGAKVILLYPDASLLKAYNYFESLQLGYGTERYVTDMANLNLHERLHMAILPDLDIPPFDNHRLVYAIASLANDVYPDKGYMAESRHISGTIYTINSVEWYLIRQNPDFFKKLMPHYLEYYQKKSPNPEEVNGWINKIDLNYFKWKQMYDAPIVTKKTTTESKQFVWARKPGAFDEVTWAVPVYNVRWPLAEETKTGWLADHNFSPTRKEGMLLYRSWKVVGVSKAGEVPDFVDTATAVAFSSDDPNYFTDLGDGKRRVSPTMEAVYSVGEWK